MLFITYFKLTFTVLCLLQISENSQPFNQQSVMGLWLGIYEAAQGSRELRAEGASPFLSKKKGLALRFSLMNLSHDIPPSFYL
jgi:hypothetical protein